MSEPLLLTFLKAESSINYLRREEVQQGIGIYLRRASLVLLSEDMQDRVQVILQA